MSRGFERPDKFSAGVFDLRPAAPSYKIKNARGKDRPDTAQFRSITGDHEIEENRDRDAQRQAPVHGHYLFEAGNDGGGHLSNPHFLGFKLNGKPEGQIIKKRGDRRGRANMDIRNPQDLRPKEEALQKS
jgi:hypothetical protein